MVLNDSVFIVGLRMGDIVGVLFIAVEGLDDIVWKLLLF